MADGSSVLATIFVGLSAARQKRASTTFFGSAPARRAYLELRARYDDLGPFDYDPEQTESHMNMTLDAMCTDT